MNTIKKVFVANRGEIAVRIIRAAHELGMHTVLGCSEVDRDSLAARMAGSVEVIGAAPAAKSYLNTVAVIDAIRRSGSDAVHPGYGFLSENSAFAAAVQAAGVVFVGPSPEAIALMGDKAAARECAMKAGVPTVPGSKGVLENAEAAELEAAVVGYPVMLKAAAGGGGRGIRVAEGPTELQAQFALATREAESAFGYGGIYLERFVAMARHVEVQILGDGNQVIHLFDRECSLQRRRQKLMEEAPSPSLDDLTRQRMCESAVALAKAVNYSGAGTIEFLYDEASREFFFIEMNTRVQVEHPVTEMITGIDIVRESLRIAAGAPLAIRQSDVQVRGVSIECRLNAENPLKQFMPSPGTLSEVILPAGPGVRVDTHIYEGYKIPPFYDSLLAKVVVLDTTREAALHRMKRALREFHVSGVSTTRDLQLALLDDAGVRAGAFHTGYVEEHLNRLLNIVR